MANPKSGSRRKLFLSAFKPFKRAFSAAKNESTYRPIRGPKGITRRQALRRVVVGAAATTATYFGARKIAKRIPFWLGARKKYSLTMVFGAHQGGAPDPEAIISEIKKARQDGKSYHLFFFEDMYSTPKEFEEKTKAINNLAKQARELHALFMGKGFSDADATKKVVEAVSRPEDKKSAELWINLALEGIKAVPIEVHLQKNADLFRKASQGVQMAQLKLISMHAKGAALTELQKQCLNELSIFDSYEHIRDKEFHNIEKRFADAIRIFPDIGQLKQVRALGQLGAAHRTFYLTFDQARSKVELNEVRIANSYELLTYSALQKPAIGITGQRETRIYALSSYVQPKIDELLSKGLTAKAKSLFQKTINLSQAEFEELSALTQNIRDPVERTRFISNWLLSN